MAAPLTLAIVRARYSAFGGAERFVMAAIEGLAGRGVEPTIVSRQWPAASNLAVIRCDPFHIGALWRDWGFARAVCRRLAHESFDIVQSHERIACCDVYRAGDGVHREWLEARRRTLGWLGRLRVDVNPYHRYLLAAERRLFESPRLRAVICNSQMVADEIRATFNIPADRLHVILSGVDTERFHPRLRSEREPTRARYGVPSDAVLFLHVGSGFERKGVGATIAALARLPASAHLLVVGRDKHAARFAALARSLGIGERVHFAGGLERVDPCYGAADAFVLPTLYDPFPNAILEAMAAGLPVVTSTKSGGAELIVAGESGWVCDALDIEAIASAMRRLLEPAARERMSRAARERVAPLTFERMSAAYVALYESLLADRRTVPS